MPRNKKALQTLDEVRDLLKRFLVLELFKMNVPQADIGKKLHMDLAAVNAFLKGIKKEFKEHK